MTATVERTSLNLTEGIHEDIPDELYHRDPVDGGSLSSTGARTLITRTPAHFAWERQHGRPDSTAFDVGRAVHHELLGGGSDFVVVDAVDWKAKAARTERDQAYANGLTPLLVAQLAQVKAMVAAVRNHETAGKLFARDGRPEVTVIARDPESGVMQRVRVDWLLPGLAIDLKTCQDASRTGMAKSMASYGYNQQGPYYTDAVAVAEQTGAPHFLLVAVEKDPPHLVGFGEPDEQAIAWGRRLNRKARDTYRQCTESGVWPGHDPRPVPLSLPGYQLNAYEAADDAGAYDTEGDHR